MQVWKIGLLGEPGDLDFGRSHHFVLASLLFYLLTFTVSILLLNMLISVVSESYRDVKKAEMATFLRARAEVIISTQLATFRKPTYKQWVHCLLPENDRSGLSKQGAHDNVFFDAKFREIEERLVERVEKSMFKSHETYTSALKSELLMKNRGSGFGDQFRGRSRSSDWGF